MRVVGDGRPYWPRAEGPHGWTLDRYSDPHRFDSKLCDRSDELHKDQVGVHKSVASPPDHGQRSGEGGHEPRLNVLPLPHRRWAQEVSRHESHPFLDRVRLKVMVAD